MFLLRNKKYIDIFWFETAPYQELCTHSYRQGSFFFQPQSIDSFLFLFLHKNLCCTVFTIYIRTDRPEQTV